MLPAVVVVDGTCTIVHDGVSWQNTTRIFTTSSAALDFSTSRFQSSPRRGNESDVAVRGWPWRAASALCARRRNPPARAPRRRARLRERIWRL